MILAEKEVLPSVCWCNDIALNAISRFNGVIIEVFGSCFERPGYVLKGHYNQSGKCDAKIIALHHYQDSFNPLELSDDMNLMQR